MKFKFKVQDYQTEAVESTVRIFEGQPKVEALSYIRDLGRLKDSNIQMKLTEEGRFESLDNQGFKNQELMIDDGTILNNVRKIQKENNIKQSSTLVRSQGRSAFDIEMETGERVIIVMGAICVIKSRVSGTLNKYISCTA